MMNQLINVNSASNTGTESMTLLVDFGINKVFRRYMSTLKDTAKHKIKPWYALPTCKNTLPLSK